MHIITCPTVTLQYFKEVLPFEFWTLNLSSRVELLDIMDCLFSHFNAAFFSKRFINILSLKKKTLATQYKGKKGVKFFNHYKVAAG